MSVRGPGNEFDIVPATCVTARSEARNERPALGTGKSAGERIGKSYLAIQAGRIEVSEELGNIVGVGDPRILRLQDEAWIEDNEVEIVVQVSGRVKSKVSVEAGLGKDGLERRVLSDPKIAKLLEGKRIVKVIVVPDKLVNFVVE